jgi:hypothetical protein
MTIKKFLSSKVVFPSDNGEIIDWIERSTIKLQFSAISQHIDFVNASIKQEQNKLELMARSFVETLDGCDNEKDSIYNAFINGGSSSFNYEYSAINDFPQIQWRSEFLVIYSYFEHTLNRLCCEVQQKSKFKLLLKDLHGSGIERARDYLVKLANVEEPFITENWQRVKFLSKIRNQIAHNNCVIEYKIKEPKSLSAKLKNEQYIKLKQLFFNKNEEAEIMLSYEFLKHSVIELENFLMEISEYCLYPGSLKNKI